MSGILRYEPKRPPQVMKIHYAQNCHKFIKNDLNNKLLLLYRHPIENILSFAFSNEHFGRSGFSDKEISDYVNHIIMHNREVFSKYFNLYVENINFYKNWSLPKHVIFYGEVMDNPLKEFSFVAEFLGVDQATTAQLAGNLDEYREIVLEHKSRDSDPFNVNTGGTDTHKFRDFLSPENLSFFNEQISKHNILLSREN